MTRVVKSQNPQPVIQELYRKEISKVPLSSVSLNVPLFLLYQAVDIIYSGTASQTTLISWWGDFPLKTANFPPVLGITFRILNRDKAIDLTHAPQNFCCTFLSRG